MRYRSVGAVLAMLVLAGGCASTGTQSGGAGKNSRVLTREEIQTAGASNMYEVVQSHRPTWLRVRGTQTFGETAQGSINEGGGAVSVPEDQIIVYLDNARLGGPPTLRQVSPGQILSAQYLDAAAATLRWGAGHTHGVILVRTTP